MRRAVFGHLDSTSLPFARQARARMGSLALAATLLFGSGIARAAGVQVTVSSQETQVGVPVVLQVKVESAQSQQPPVIPDIPNVKIRSRGGPSQSSQTTIINGVVKSESSLTYVYELTPQTEGRFTIPPISLRGGGGTGASEPITVVVTKSETGDLLFVEIKGNRKRLYVGESLGVKLQIWLRPYTDAQYRRKLRESEMWSLIGLRESEWGSFTEPLQQKLSQGDPPVGHETLRKDSQGQERSYYLYEIERTIQVNRPGQLGAEDINVVVTYPTRLGRSNDVFSMGQLGIVSAMRISGQAKVEPIEVLPVPSQGRPAVYNGAVGRYTIKASAKPTEVAVGDPITLTLVVSGSSNLADLQPPLLANVPELTNSFRIPSEPLAGELVPDGKSFSVSIRATADTVAQIPAIPFGYFDPVSEKFVTVSSDPIPLKVKAADKLAMSQIVDAGGNRPAAANRLTESAGGILANYTGMDEVLTQQGFEPGSALAVLAILPPLSFVVSWTFRRRSDRLRNDVGFARKRRARREALARLRAAGAADAREVAATVTAALGQYVADRRNLPPGGMTRASVVRELRSTKVSEPLISEVDNLLAECEGLHYGGSGSRTPAEMLQAAVNCVESLERESW